MRSGWSVLAVFLLVCAWFATVKPSGQPAIQIQFQNGKVSLRAEDATPRQILEEWARKGGTRVINSESAPTAPASLVLVDVPERQALEAVLRGAAGFVATSRDGKPNLGESSLERIVLGSVGVPPPTAARAPASPVIDNSAKAATGVVIEEIPLEHASGHDAEPADAIRDAATGAVRTGDAAARRSEPAPPSPMPAGVTPNSATGAPTASQP